MRNKKVRALVLCLIVASLIATTFGAMAKYEKDQFDARTEEAEEYKQTLASNTRKAYIATANITKGEKLYTQQMVDDYNAAYPAEEAKDEETAGAVLSDRPVANIEPADIYSSAPAETFITQDELDKGAYAVVDIAESQPVSTNMARNLEITKDTREFEITAAHLMVDQKQNEAVDVRIVYPNGEDYVVLSKKYIRNLSLKNATWFTDMSEDEIVRFQSAVIDAYTTTGARLYTTRYVEDNLQDAATVNYIPRTSTIDLINSDPNIYTKAAQTLNTAARLSLEVRLGNLSEDQLSAVSSGFGLSDTAANAVIKEKVDTYQNEIDELGISDDNIDTTDSVDTSMEDVAVSGESITTDTASADTSASTDIISK